MIQNTVTVGNLYLSSLVLSSIEDDGGGGSSEPLSNYLDKRTGGEISGNIEILSGNYIQTSTPLSIHNYSAANGFMQAESIKYGDPAIGSKAYCILSVVVPENAIIISGDLGYSNIASKQYPTQSSSRTFRNGLGNGSISYTLQQSLINTSNTDPCLSDLIWSLALFDIGNTNFGHLTAIEQTTIEGIQGTKLQFDKLPTDIGSAITGKSLTEYISDFINVNGDNALYVRGFVELGNQIPPQFISQYATGGAVRAIGKYTHAEGRDTIADGRYAHAEGSMTIAGGLASHAEGQKNIAVGYNSHAEGVYTIAFGENSHAEGISSYAAEAAHAEGGAFFETSNGKRAGVYEGGKATGIGSHAEGAQTSAIGYYSHSEGFKSIANGRGSHAEGGYQKLGSNAIGGYAIGDASHAEGVQTSAIAEYSHAEGRDTYANAPGTHVEGYSTSAFGNYSHAEGDKTYTNASGTHVEGYSTSAFGNYSHAENYGTSVSGLWSHAEGYATKSNGNYSHAEGRETYAGITNKSGAHAEGWATSALADYSHSEGKNTYIADTAAQAHVEGFETSAFADTTHAEGYRSQVLKQGAHAEGGGNGANGGTASNYGAHAEGITTIADGMGAHAEGNITSALGDYSHAEGWATSANGKTSHAAGINAIASADYQFVWNGDKDRTKYNPYEYGALSGSFCIRPVNDLKGFYVNDKSMYDVVYKNNPLAGKSLAVVGDSFSMPITSDGAGGFRQEDWVYTPYCKLIADANNMSLLANCSNSNLKMSTGTTGGTKAFSENGSSLPYNYFHFKQWLSSADYILFQLGLNDGITATTQIGDSSSTTTNTLFGAWNVVLSTIYDWNPKPVKIGIIISDSWMNEISPNGINCISTYTTLKQIANYWGIPYLDLKEDQNVPQMLGNRTGVNPFVIEKNKQKFDALRPDGETYSLHPNQKCHNFRAPIIEKFMRGL